MDFQIQGAIFKQSDEDNQKRFKDKYDPSKKYPQVRGEIRIRRDELVALCKKLQEYSGLDELKTYKFSYYNKETGERELQDHIGIPLDVTGYFGKTSNDTQMVSLTVSDHWLMQKMLKEQQEAQSSASEAAASLAESTSGTVVKPKEDLFS